MESRAGRALGSYDVRADENLTHGHFSVRGNTNEFGTQSTTTTVPLSVKSSRSWATCGAPSWPVQVACRSVPAVSSSIARSSSASRKRTTQPAGLTGKPLRPAPGEVAGEAGGRQAARAALTTRPGRHAAPVRPAGRHCRERRGERPRRPTSCFLHDLPRQSRFTPW